MKPTAMKTTASAQPRLTCRLARAWSAWREDDATRPAPGLAARHAAACPDCAQHFAALSALENELRQEARALAAQAEPALPLGLEDRIFAAVRPIVREQARTRRAPAWTRWLPVALGTAAALAVAAVMWNGTPGHSTSLADDIAFTQQDLQQLTASIESFSQKVLSAPATNTAATSQPDALSAELKALRADGQAALRFLERSFLPSSLTGGGQSDATEING